MFDKQVRIIKDITSVKPKTAIVLGSGLGDLINKVNIDATISYEDIPNMPVSTAPGHNGKLIFGRLEDKDVVLMQGRVHLYEGYSSQEAVFPIRLLKALGVETLILTNASGGINKDFRVGDLMLINDHISCFVDSPLIGPNNDELGTRFPDMSNAYDKNLRKTVKKIANDNKIPLVEGVYAQLRGPQFETPAEIHALSVMGADAVGMSTVIETIAACHCGLKVCAISLITNLACGILDAPLSSEDVNLAAEKSGKKLEELIALTVRNL
ncbi:MAG: purine-nucleoside phosphorylase [Eubacterium sp.]